MGATRTPGITIGADGRFFIDKRHRGIRIGVRVGATNQEQAEQRLRTETPMATQTPPLLATPNSSTLSVV